MSEEVVVIEGETEAGSGIMEIFLDVVVIVGVLAIVAFLILKFRKKSEERESIRKLSVLST